MEITHINLFNIGPILLYSLFLLMIYLTFAYNPVSFIILCVIFLILIVHTLLKFL